MDEKKWNGLLINKKNNKYASKINNGKGYIKEYDSENRLEFEGEYSNEQINGKGKEYYRS